MGPQTLRDMATIVVHQDGHREDLLLLAVADAWEADRKRLERVTGAAQYLLTSMVGVGQPTSVLDAYHALVEALSPNDTSQADPSQKSPEGQSVASVLIDGEEDAFKVWADAQETAWKHWNEECAKNYETLSRIAVHILRTRVCPECESVIQSGINRCPHCQGE